MRNEGNQFFSFTLKKPIDFLVNITFGVTVILIEQS